MTLINNPRIIQNLIELYPRALQGLRQEEVENEWHALTENMVDFDEDLDVDYF